MEKRRWEKQLGPVIAGLILLNCLTVVYFLTNKDNQVSSQEVVATVGEEEITSQDLLHILEEKYGEPTLRELINEEVINQLAKKYNIKIPDSAIERELLLIKTMYGTTANASIDEDSFQKQIETSLMLEEILTRDVNVPEEELQAYYEENISLYQIPTSYHISHIVVKTIEEANQALEELEQGSSFTALAMEKSIDELSAGHGGDIGFIHEGESRFSGYFDIVKNLKPGKWSKPVSVDGGYAIVLLHEVVEGKNYQFKDMKNEIRRLIALEQMEGRSSVESFWDEVNVQWLYGENKED